ncbi:MAG TPA: GNAT family N-acetyltransferase [Candidatus Didemnitutus sp.]|nr:GNAT family N-acetyltransferase [Candidatus Didemnitutus sp.]
MHDPVAPVEVQLGDYVVSDDPKRLDVDAVHRALTASYWATGIPRELIERALRGSLCVGAYHPQDGQVGLARFISDFATFCYVCDVYVLEPHRGRRLAAAMLRLATDHPRLQGLRRWSLVTRDAHKLYEPLGFKPVGYPSRHMERVVPNIYLRPEN